MQYNRLMNQARKPKDAVFFRYHPPHGNLSGSQPQSMWIWKGLTLVGASGACPKGILVEVEDVSPAKVTLSNERRRADSRAGVQMHASGALPRLRVGARLDAPGSRAAV
jgi:hypothetical protein